MKLEKEYLSTVRLHSNCWYMNCNLQFVQSKFKIRLLGGERRKMAPHECGGGGGEGRKVIRNIIQIEKVQSNGRIMNINLVEMKWKNHNVYRREFKASQKVYVSI